MKVSYWECLTHECGSTKFNNLQRHYWEVCDIEKKIGTPQSNTWHNENIGGLNGDVSRKFYKAWDSFCLDKQQMTQRKDNWVRQLSAHQENAVRKN